MNIKHLLPALICAGIPLLAAAGTPVPRTINVTFTVNSVADSVDVNPGDGICQDASGQCSLRAAIMEANALAGPDTIVFDPITDGQPQLLQIHGAGENAAATGDLDITEGLTITGNGTGKTIIDGDGADRVFDILSATGTVEIDDLTIQNGKGVTEGGGLRAFYSTLILKNDLVQNNTAQNLSGVAEGGGIYCQNALVTLDNTTVKGNTASASSAAYGGGVSSDNTTPATGVLSIYDGSLVTGNLAQGGSYLAAGGGVAILDDSVLAMDSSAVKNNQAIDTDTGGSADGGGIVDAANNSNGAYSIINSEISGNTAHGDASAFGGGVNTNHVAVNSAFINTTISGNSAIADNGSTYGGGVGLATTGSGVTELLGNVTLSGNSVQGVASQGGGMAVYNNTGTVSVQNSIVAGNQDANATAPDCVGASGGTLTSGGYNLIGDDTGCSFANATGDQVGTGSAPIDPLLGTLADNGGKTQTMALLAGSPAVDAGNPAGCKDASGATLTRDQRNSPRPEDGNASGTAICDIGAYERAADTPPTASNGSVSTTVNQSVSGTLAASDPNGDALIYSIASQPAHGTVTLTNTSTGAFRYTPAQKYKGSDSFTFTVNDGFVNSGTATETITVKSAPSGGGGGGGSLGGFALLALLTLALMPWWRRQRPRAGTGPGVWHLAACACVALALAGAPGLAAALTFTVNSTADAPDAAINSVCDDGTGHCTLRAAVQEANGNPGADNIVFDPSLDGKPIVLTLHGANEDAAATGDLDITDDVTIDGRGSSATIIDGDAADRVFEVISGTLNLQHVDVRNGGAVEQGAGIRVDGGATLNLFNASVTDNHATGSDSNFVKGGGIMVDANGYFGADSSLIDGNSAESSGSVAEGGGLDLETGNTVGIVFTGITNNTATSTSNAQALGGGIHSHSFLSMQDCFVRGNTAHSDQGTVLGGGIGIDVITGSLTLSRVEISGNAAEAPNGSAEGGAIDSGSPVTLINTTVTGNTGGVAGIYQGTGLLTLVNTTIYGNTGSGVGGVFIYSNTSANLADTIIAGNTGTSPDCQASGPITSYGYNLIGDTTHCTFAAAIGDQFGTASNPINPELGPLTTGGQTHALPLLSNSPALDKGDPQLQSQGGTCQATDQLGNTRPVDGNGDGTAVCDIGAVERGPNHPPQAANGSLATKTNQTTTGTLSATDADGDPLVFAVAQPAAHGTVSITDPATGAFTYTPNQGYKGSDSFTFNASDGIDTSSAATESITITAPPGNGGGGGGLGLLVLLGLLLLALMPWWLRRHRPIAAGTVASVERNLPMKRVFKIHYLAAIGAALISGILLTAAPALAAPGDVDTTFNGGVPAVIDPGTGNIYDVLAGAIDPSNGDIFWSGNYNVDSGAIAAYKPDGTPDTAFGGVGEVILTAGAVGFSGGTMQLNGIAIDGQGRILLAGVAYDSSGGGMLLMRLNPDGSFDTSFGASGTGYIISSPGQSEGTGISITADGHILVTGDAYDSGSSQNTLTVWRYSADGTPDNSFGSGGYVQVAGVKDGLYLGCKPALQPDDTLIVGCERGGASDWVAVHLMTDGSMDTNFGSSGFVTSAASMDLYGLALAPDNSFVIGEANYNSPPPTDLRRFLADGSVDTSFNSGNPFDLSSLMGTATRLPVGAQADAKALISGNNGAGALNVVRLLTNGTLDSNFGTNGVGTVDFSNIGGSGYTSEPTAVLLQGDGKIVVLGYAVNNTDSRRISFVTRLDNDAFDFTPATFSFMARTGVALSTLITSNAITVSGLSSGTSVPVSVSGGEYQINSGAWTSTPGFTQNGDQIAVRHTSSSNFSTQTTTTLTVGGQVIANNNSAVLGSATSATFTSTTKAKSTGGSGGGGGGSIGLFALLALLTLAPWPLLHKRQRPGK